MREIDDRYPEYARPYEPVKGGKHYNRLIGSALPVCGALVLGVSVMGSPLRNAPVIGTEPETPVAAVIAYEPAAQEPDTVPDAFVGWEPIPENEEYPSDDLVSGDEPDEAEPEVTPEPDEPEEAEQEPDSTPEPEEDPQNAPAPTRVRLAVVPYSEPKPKLSPAEEPSATPEISPTPEVPASVPSATPEVTPVMQPAVNPYTEVTENTETPSVPYTGPSETTDPEPAETPQEVPSEDSGTTPATTPEENPDVTPSENPDDTPSENPDDTPSEDPDNPPEENPDDTPSEDPDATPSEDPDDTPAEKTAPSMVTTSYGSGNENSGAPYAYVGFEVTLNDLEGGTATAVLQRQNSAGEFEPCTGDGSSMEYASDGSGVWSGTLTTPIDTGGAMGAREKYRVEVTYQYPDDGSSSGESTEEKETGDTVTVYYGTYLAFNNDYMNGRAASIAGENEDAQLFIETDLLVDSSLIDDPGNITVSNTALYCKGWIGDDPDETEDYESVPLTGTSTSVYTDDNGTHLLITLQTGVTVLEGSFRLSAQASHPESDGGSWSVPLEYEF